ncbi:MAG: hypothetical protein CMI54_04705 [Parcubacteria group bacterium]|jgi:hypothetical protein|nr:hypothetical protein [Parcubacteria group bacterium]|tara:strand:+ start:988 stop:1185 length:198 start_codon:yes stop_codon:yes gene_type:complete
MTESSFTQRPPIFLVWNPHTSQVVYRHETVEDAEKEADRLARENPGIKFHVLMSLGRCLVGSKKK